MTAVPFTFQDSESTSTSQVMAQHAPLIGGTVFQARSWSLKSSSQRKTARHKCPHCEYSSYWTTNVKKHVFQKHTTHRPFPCPMCPLGFAEKADLNRHVNVHTKPFRCSLCPMRFSKKFQLVNHRSKKHSLPLNTALR